MALCLDDKLFLRNVLSHWVQWLMKHIMNTMKQCCGVISKQFSRVRLASAETTTSCDRSLNTVSRNVCVQVCVCSCALMSLCICESWANKECGTYVSITTRADKTTLLYSAELKTIAFRLLWSPFFHHFLKFYLQVDSAYLCTWRIFTPGLELLVLFYSLSSSY